MQKQEFWWIGQRAMDSTAVGRVYPVKNVISCDYDSNHLQYCDNLFSLEQTIKLRKNWGNDNITEIFENEDLKRAVQLLIVGDGVINIIPYAASPLLEKFFSEIGNNFKIFACTSQLKMKFDSKFFLRDVLSQRGLDIIPGEEVFEHTDFNDLSDRYGLPFILQEDISSAGKGTKRIKNKADYHEAMKSSQRKFAMRLIPNSRTYALHCCITKTGYVFSPIALQISEDPTLSNESFCYSGNDFSQPNHVGSELRQNIYSQVKRLGEYLRKEGWMGIFNVDVVCGESDDIYIVDLNPRLTGAIQFLTDIQLIAGEEPISKHHIKSFMGIEETAPEQPENPIWGSQIILHNLEGCKVQVKKAVKPGIYEMIDGQMVFKRGGLSVFDCRTPEEFVINCAVAQEGMLLSENASLLRVQSKYSYAEPNGKLNEIGREVARAVYGSFEFEKMD